MPNLSVYFLPTLADEDSFDDQTVVVIDVLRATTTIAHALEAGAEAVIPCLEVEEAIQLANSNSNILAGGERGGLRVEGFSLSNSPGDYAPHIVRRKTIAMTTTNGTAALNRCKTAHRVFTAGFVNYSATCELLQQATRNVAILCSGTRNKITREDVIVAGAIAHELFQSGEWTLDDQALLAVDVWQAVMARLRAGESLAHEIGNSIGGRNLTRLDYAHDIEIASQIDKFDFACELDLNDWKIRKVV